MIYYYHNNFLVCNLAEWIIKKKTTRNYQRICAAWRWERFKTWRTKHGGTFVRLYHSLLFVCFSACLSLYYHHYPLVSLSCLPVSFRFCLLYSPPPPTESLWIWWIGRWMALVRLIRPAIESARIGLKKKTIQLGFYYYFYYYSKRSDRIRKKK